MKVFSVKSNQNSFKGMALPTPPKRIANAADAIAQWQILKHPQYTNIFQEAEPATKAQILENKKIRDNNYSFLDMLKGDGEKKKFIEHFKNLTGFPFIKDSSKKILEEFYRVLGVAAVLIGASKKDVLLTGYDKFCSVGLGNALPGSDLDKGYAIIKGKTDYLPFEKSFSDEFKGYIWENIDNRIMSVNHCAAFPNIMTDNELALSLNKFDAYARDFVTEENFNRFRYERMINPNPVSGAKFNIWLSQRLPDSYKSDAKNFAYVIEAIRDGERGEYNPRYYEKLCYQMNNSIFGHCTNVTQGYTMQQKYDYAEADIVKPKLKARKEIEKHFDSWSISKQFDLVKDVIRSMSGDNKDPQFDNLFAAKADRHRLLINDILRGNIDCDFEFLGQGRERTHLFFNSPEMAEKYHDLNVYKTDY